MSENVNLDGQLDVNDASDGTISDHLSRLFHSSSRAWKVPPCLDSCLPGSMVLSWANGKIRRGKYRYGIQTLGSWVVVASQHPPPSHAPELSDNRQLRMGYSLVQ